MSRLFPKESAHGIKRLAFATFYMAAVFLVAGCDSSRRLTAYDDPFQYNPLACIGFLVIQGADKLPQLPIEVHRKLAQEGDVTCQLSLGNRYERGLDAPVDYEQARKWYSMLPYRDLQLGRMAEEGVGQPVDLQQAKDHYRKAAELGFVGGHLALGNLLERESNSETERQEVMAHYFKATKSYGDDGWKGIQRLISQGTELNVEQKKQYAQYWFGKIDSIIRFNSRRSKRLRELLALPGVNGSVEVTCTYFTNGDAPNFGIARSSGVPELDALVIGWLQDYKMDTLRVLDMGNTIQFPLRVTLQ